MSRHIARRRRGASGSEYGMGAGLVGAAALVALLQAGGSIDSLLDAAVNEIADTANTVADGGGTTPPANTPPTFDLATATLTTPEDVNAAIDGILGVSDPDSGQTLTWQIVAVPGHGTVSGLPLDAAATPTATPTGAVYQPDVDFNGSDAFIVEVTDGAGGRDTLDVVVTVEPTDDAPVFTASNPGITVGEDGSTDVSGALEVADADSGDTLTWSLVSEPANGTVSGLDATASADGGGAQPSDVTYTPDPDFVGTDSFDVAITDASGESSVITVSVEVTQTNDAPQFVETGGSIAVPVGQTTDIADLLAVTDPDPDETLTWTVVSGPWRGTLTNVDGATTSAGGNAVPTGATYTPGDVGTGDSVTVEVRDSSGAVATISLGFTAEYVVGTKITGDAVYVGKFIWGNYGQDTAVGAHNGRYNTDLLVNRGGHPAANACENLEHDGYTDWYLPSATELGNVPKIPGTHGNDTQNMFWSSSEEHIQYENRQQEYAAFTLVPGYNPRYEGWFTGKNKTPHHVLCIR